jgi:acyl carrier protein
MANGVYMTKEQIRASIPGIMAQVIPDEGPSNVWGDIPIREQVGAESMDFPDIIMELPKGYRVRVADDDYMQLATLDNSIAYLGSRAKDL